MEKITDYNVKLLINLPKNALRALVPQGIRGTEIQFSKSEFLKLLI